MIKSNNKFVYVNIELYSHYVCFSINQTDAQFLQSMHSHKLVNKKDKNVVDILLDPFKENVSTTSSGICVKYPGGGIVIRTFRDLVTPEGLGTISHEIYHAAMYILDCKGMSPNEHTEEAYAYLIGFLTKKFYESFKIWFDE